MDVFVTGGTGYIGRRVVAALCARGHLVRVLVRAAPSSPLPAVVATVTGNALGELLPPTRESAQRLGLVSIAQMVRALVKAVEAPPPAGTRRIVEGPGIRRAQPD